MIFLKYSHILFSYIPFASSLLLSSISHISLYHLYLCFSSTLPCQCSSHHQPDRQQPRLVYILPHHGVSITESGLSRLGEIMWTACQWLTSCLLLGKNAQFSIMSLTNCLIHSCNTGVKNEIERLFLGESVKSNFYISFTVSPWWATVYLFPF